MLNQITCLKNNFIFRLFLIIIISCCFEFIIYCQKMDYKMWKDSLTQLSCIVMDSMTVIETRKNLESFDTSLIESNIDMYYHDLGWCYYMLYFHTKDTAYIRMASLTYDKALYHNPNNSKALWEKSFYNYFFYKDCIKGKYFMDRYKKSTRKKYWNKEQIRLLSAKCDKNRLSTKR